MQDWQDRGLVLHVGYFGESHMWVKAIFEHRGVQTLFAFGGAISRRRFCGCLDAVNLLHCLVHPTRNDQYFVLKEATLLNHPTHLRSNWHALGALNNCFRFFEAVGESSRECFAILNDLVGYLDKKISPSWFLPLFFRLRIGAALGYSPNFQVCGECGQLLISGTFLADDGRTYCPDCIKVKNFQEKRRSFMLNQDMLGFLNQAVRILPSQLDTMRLNPADLRQCARAIDGFVEFHLGIIWDNGSFHRV